MKAKFISGPLHEHVLSVGGRPPDRWIAPSVPLGRNGKEPSFRPVRGAWGDPSAPVRLDVYEYELSTCHGEAVYLLKTLHRADGSKLEFGSGIG